MSSQESASSDPIPGLDAIIFVTGASRSGTTMMSRVLGNHSNIIGLSELHYFGDLCDLATSHEQLEIRTLERFAATLFSRQERDIWGEGPTESEIQKAKCLVTQLRHEECTAAGVFSAVIGQLASEVGKNMACEQTPRNIFYAEHLLSVYPNAFVVHMMRDPRAVLASQKNRWQMRRLGGRNVPLSEVIRSWFNYHPVTMCRLWVSATAVALRLRTHPRFMILRFEDLAADPDRYVRDLCDFLGIKYEQEMLAIPQWGSSNIRHTSDKKGISKEMLGKWVETLTPGEIAITEYMTGSFMKQFSYIPARTGGIPVLAALSCLLKYPIHIVGAMVANPRRVWIQLKALIQVGSKD